MLLLAGCACCARCWCRCYYYDDYYYYYLILPAYLLLGGAFDSARCGACVRCLSRPRWRRRGGGAAVWWRPLAMCTHKALCVQSFNNYIMLKGLIQRSHIQMLGAALVALGVPNIFI